mgnify:CR=1 FL=1
MCTAHREHPPCVHISDAETCVCVSMSLSVQRATIPQCEESLTGIDELQHPAPAAKRSLSRGGRCSRCGLCPGPVISEVAHIGPRGNFQTVSSGVLRLLSCFACPPRMCCVHNPLVLCMQPDPYLALQTDGICGRARAGVRPSDSTFLHVPRWWEPLS